MVAQVDHKEMNWLIEEVFVFYSNTDFYIESPKCISLVWQIEYTHQWWVQKVAVVVVGF